MSLEQLRNKRSCFEFTPDVEYESNSDDYYDDLVFEKPSRTLRECIFELNFLYNENPDSCYFQTVMSLLNNLCSECGYDSIFTSEDDLLEYPISSNEYIVVLPCKLEGISARAKWVIEMKLGEGKKENEIADLLLSLGCKACKEWVWKFDQENFVRLVEERKLDAGNWLDLDSDDDWLYKEEQKEINKWANYYARYVE